VRKTYGERARGAREDAMTRLSRGLGSPPAAREPSPERFRGAADRRECSGKMPKPLFLAVITEGEISSN